MFNNFILPSEKSVVFLMCGFIGSGKTTAAAKIATDYHAYNLTLDEWVNEAYGTFSREKYDFDPQDRAKALHWKVTEQAIKLKANVVLDWGFWIKSERSKWISKIEASDALAVLLYVNSDYAKCRERVIKRNATLDAQSVPIDMHDFESWWPIFEEPRDEKFILLEA